ncbi:MAG: ferrous iron transporter B, partial [Erysipelotrichaceae bacterium]|nr:ferrous iron transporter B [Erysipelotrichaceae bacterium]
MKIALVGNPNSGKTTLFNALTGSTAHVGNWPGVTVDKKVGFYKKLSSPIEIVDLPGIYSLSPYTPEEVISRSFIIDEKPDCLINIIDATNLERNLYLTTQLLELDIPLVIAVNMMDLIEKHQGQIDLKQLTTFFKVPIIPISAAKERGLDELMEITAKTAAIKRKGTAFYLPPHLNDLLHQVSELYETKSETNHLFHAIKMIESDEIERKRNIDIAAATDELKASYDTGIFAGDFEAMIADARYKYLEKISKPVITKKARKDGLTKSDRIDRVLTHRFFAIPIFFIIIFLVFHLTFSEDLFFLSLIIPKGSFEIPIIGTDAINSPAVMLFNLMELLTSSITTAIINLLPSGTWYTGLIADGLLKGLFTFLNFLPQILTLFLFLTILEDSGYMARVAFIMDRA